MSVALQLLEHWLGTHPTGQARQQETVASRAVHGNAPFLPLRAGIISHKQNRFE